MKRFWMVMAMVVLAVLFCPQARADDVGAPGALKVEESRVRVIDEFGRPYTVPQETAWLGVRLAQGDEETPAVKEAKTLATNGLEYDADADAWSYYPLLDGQADAKFVVFEDSAKNPVNYELSLFEKSDNGSKKLTTIFKNIYEAGSGAQSSLMKAAARRPLLTSEKVMLGAFVIITILISYLLLGRDLFRRMLFNRRLEVDTALLWSNVLLLIFILLTILTGVGVYEWPKVLWGSVFNIYLVASGAYIALLLATYGIGLAVTRR